MSSAAFVASAKAKYTVAVPLLAKRSKLVVAWLSLAESSFVIVIHRAHLLHVGGVHLARPVACCSHLTVPVDWLD